ncbi:hypothetical protein PVK06_048439 [Gossypium arboreum]|uniref:Uncharacterized protein n=1 Tax=Gossypium arboreum TaxID=29729 RepID=A0ABR0MG98_GOSAR|nr:hypothetical protein PVK06_048439 [Gossypium arboreum]
MHPEKGFTLKESNYIDFMARIRQVAETLNWELFYEKRPSLDKELVREFYANLTSSELKEVPVHGIKGIIIDWDLYRIDGESILQQQVEESEDHKEEEEDPTMQSAEFLDKAGPMEPEAEPNVETSMFRAQSPRTDLQDELSKLMDIMQHMQWIDIIFQFFSSGGQILSWEVLCFLSSGFYVIEFISGRFSPSPSLSSSLLDSTLHCVAFDRIGSLFLIPLLFRFSSGLPVSLLMLNIFSFLWLSKTSPLYPSLHLLCLGVRGKYSRLLFSPHHVLLRFSALFIV